MIATLQELKDSPTIINTWNLDQIEQFERIYYRKRIDKSIRLSINARRADIKRELYLKKRANSLFWKLESLWDRVYHVHTKPHYEHKISNHARSVGQDIYDLPVIWSGYKSLELIKYNKTALKPIVGTPEHYYPRQWSGIQIINRIKQDYSSPTLKADIYGMLREFSHVHRVTSQENVRLRQMQSVDEFIDPLDSYEQAGIELTYCADEKLADSPWDLVISDDGTLLM